MDKQKLVVAGVPEHFNLPWHLANDAGDFSAAGVDLVYRDYPGGTGAMTKAIANGEVDMAILLTEGAVANLIRNGATRLIKAYVQSPLIWGIHVAADSNIQEIEQIQGSRYAISRLGSGSHLMAIVDAAERGWGTSQIQFETVGNLDGARRALAAGKADTFFWEQFTTQPFVDNGEFRRIGTRLTLWPAFVIAVNQSVLESKASLVAATLKVINRHCGKLMENPAAASLISQRYELELPQVREWLSLTKWSTDFNCPTEAIQKTLDYLNRLGIINAPNATPADVWLDIDSV